MRARRGAAILAAKGDLLFDENGFDAMDTEALICVVDDDAVVRESLSDLLRSADYRVASFESAQSFLDSAERNECACVVADIHMRGLTGIDLAKRVAAAADAPKVILITGHLEECWRERALYSGAAGFLKKPIESKTLLDLVERSVGT
jgi:FixJ family two-component response regulator